MSSSISNIDRKFHFYQFLGVLEINKISSDDDRNCSYICTIQGQREVLEDSCDKIKEKIVKSVEEKLPRAVTALGNMYINGTFEEIDVSKFNAFEYSYEVSFTDQSSTILRHYRNDDEERFDKLLDSIRKHLENSLFEYSILVQKIKIFSKLGVLTINSSNFDKDAETGNVKCVLSYFINENFGIQGSHKYVSRNIGRTGDDAHAQCLNNIIFDILDNGGSALIKITNMMLDGTVTNVGTVLSAIEKNKVFMLFNLGKDSHAYTFKNNWSRFDKLLAKIEKGLADKAADMKECMRELAILEKLGLVTGVKFGEFNNFEYGVNFISLDDDGVCRRRIYLDDDGICRRHSRADTNLPKILHFLRKQIPFYKFVKLTLMGDITDIHHNIRNEVVSLSFKYLGRHFSDSCIPDPVKNNWTPYYNMLKKFSDEIHYVDDPVPIPSTSSSHSIPLETVQIPKLFFHQPLDDYEGIVEITNFDPATMMVEKIEGLWTLKCFDESTRLNFTPVIKIDDQANWVTTAFDFAKLYDPTKIYLFLAKRGTDSPAAMLYFHLLKK